MLTPVKTSSYLDIIKNKKLIYFNNIHKKTSMSFSILDIIKNKKSLNNRIFKIYNQTEPLQKFFISCTKSRIETNRCFYGCFSLGPFDPGQSLTVANALRRTLLSELKGIAITSVEIEGALHEYSNLPGVRDSILDILLNLKEIILKKKPYLKCLKTQVGYLRAQGPGVVKASDLLLPPFIQCVDPEQYIATLADDGILNMKFCINEGKNYHIQTNKLNLELHNLSSFARYTSSITDASFFAPRDTKKDLINKKNKKDKSLVLNLQSKSKAELKAKTNKKMLQKQENKKEISFTSESKMRLKARNYQKYKNYINMPLIPYGDSYAAFEQKATQNKVKTKALFIFTQRVNIKRTTHLKNRSKQKLPLLKFFNRNIGPFLRSVFTPRVNIKRAKLKRKGLIYGPFSSLTNFKFKQSGSNPLLIDPVFMPILKVNYILESHELANDLLDENFENKPSNFIYNPEKSFTPIGGTATALFPFPLREQNHNIPWGVEGTSLGGQINQDTLLISETNKDQEKKKTNIVSQVPFKQKIHQTKNTENLFLSKANAEKKVLRKKSKILFFSKETPNQNTAKPDQDQEININPASITTALSGTQESTLSTLLISKTNKETNISSNGQNLNVNLTYPAEDENKNKQSWIQNTKTAQTKIDKKQTVILEIWTNGSIHPRQALYQALKNLLSVFGRLKKVKFMASMYKAENSYKTYFNGKTLRKKPNLNLRNSFYKRSL